MTKVGGAAHRTGAPSPYSQPNPNMVFTVDMTTLHPSGKSAPPLPTPTDSSQTQCSPAFFTSAEPAQR